MREWIQAILWVVRAETPADPREDMDKVPPFDLSFGGVVEHRPPEMQFRGERFRVSLFPQTKRDGRRCNCCGRPFRWLVFEFLNNEKRWQHLLTLHETHLVNVKDVLDEVTSYLNSLASEKVREEKHTNK